jgi:hypothetical protein
MPLAQPAPRRTAAVARRGADTGIMMSAGPPACRPGQGPGPGVRRPSSSSLRRPSKLARTLARALKAPASKPRRGLAARGVRGTGTVTEARGPRASTQMLRGFRNSKQGPTRRVREQAESAKRTSPSTTDCTIIDDLSDEQSSCETDDSSQRRLTLNTTRACECTP